MKLRVFVCIAVSVSSVAAASGQTIWYVDGAASTNGSGTSWISPFNNLPSAFAAASSLNDPQDEIWVKATTNGYTPATQTSTFQLKANVGVYGGFAGGETSRARGTRVQISRFSRAKSV